MANQRPSHNSVIIVDSDGSLEMHVDVGHGSLRFLAVFCAMKGHLEGRKYNYVYGGGGERRFELFDAQPAIRSRSLS